MRLNFSEALKAAVISNPSAVFTVTQGATSFSINTAAISGNTVTLTLAATLAAGDTFVAYNGTVLEDAAGNKTAAIASTKVTSTDIVAPTLASSNPADESTTFGAASNLVLTFSEAVAAGTGSIKLVNTADATDTRTIDVKDATQVTISGSTLTINPTADLKVSSTYAVNIDATAVLDVAGNAYAGIANNTTLNFTTTAPVVAGQTFTLTANADGPGAIAPAVNTQGTTGDDVFNAVDTTLNSADNLAGAGGVDTLNVRATAAAAVAPAMSSVEAINVSHIGGFTYSLNLASATGVQVAASKDQSAVAATITDITNLAATGVVARLDNADGTTQFNFLGAAARTGTADAVSIQIANGSGTAAAVATLNITNGVAGGGAGPDATFENLNVATSGAASYVNSALGGANARVITVTGDVAADTNGYGLTLTEAASFAAARSVDASGLSGTGGLNVDIDAAVFASLAVVGSKNNDRVVVDGTTANAANTWSLNGGLGTDTLGVDALTVFTAATNPAVVQTVNTRATGFEVLEATIADVTALKADDFTGINAFVFSGLDGSHTTNLAITGVETGDSFKFTTAVASNAGNNDIVTLSGSVAGQSAIVELNASTGVNAGLTAIGTGNALTVNNGITSVTIQSTGSNPGAANTNTIQSATTIAAIDNVTATNFTITGSQALNIGAAAGVAGMLGFTNAASVDGSAATGVLRIAGSAVADQIKGGAGNDIIYGLGGNDLLTGNGGADQFRYTAGNEGTDRITDFTVGTDKIGTNFIAFAGTTASAAGATLVATDYEAARNDITGIVAGDTLKVIELQTGLTTAQITAQVGAAADALVLVFNTTTNKGELWYDNDWSNVATRSQVATFDNIVDLAGVKAFSNTDFVEFTA